MGGRYHQRGVDIALHLPPNTPTAPEHMGAAADFRRFLPGLHPIQPHAAIQLFM